MTTWKSVERAIAKHLDGQRVGVTGRATPDVITDSLSVECKHRKALPKWLKSAMAQAEVNAAGKVPVVVLHEKYKRHVDDLVVLRLSEFRDLVVA